MKTNRLTLTAALTCILLPFLCGCSEPQRVASIVLDKSFITLHIGETADISCTTDPMEAAAEIKWESSAEDVAAVSQEGRVAAFKAGETTITATAGNITESCIVTVLEDAVESITPDRDTLKMIVGQTETIAITVSPETYGTDRITWTSTNTSVASVDAGKVTATGPGTAQILIKADTVTAKCSIFVSEEQVTGLSLNKTTTSIIKGQQEQLTLTIEPSSISPDAAEWYSTDESVATVDENGLVSTYKMGFAKIVAKVAEHTAKCDVFVTAKPVESINVHSDKSELTVGETLAFTAEILPSDADYDNIGWKTSDPSVASINAEGILTAHKAGSTDVIAYVGDTEGSTTITVTGVPVESVTLNFESYEMLVNETLQLEAAVLPENAADKTITWSSSNTSAATVSEGLVTAISEGETTISAKAGDITATCKITVVSSRQAKIGDYFFSDGTYASTPDPAKEVIGIVFWTGNPAEYDPILKKDHPECTHGLVLAVSGEYECAWQPTMSSSSVGEWVTANLPEYLTITVESGTEQFNQPLGYNNTKAIEQYNEAPENNACRVEAAVKCQEFRASTPAPANTSGWYIPSIKEASLLCSGDYDGDISEITSDNSTATAVNQAMKAVPSGISLSFSGIYWTSSELNSANVHVMSFKNGRVSSDFKMFNNTALRFILAF